MKKNQKKYLFHIILIKNFLNFPSFQIFQILIKILIVLNNKIQMKSKLSAVSINLHQRLYEFLMNINFSNIIFNDLNDYKFNA